MTYTEEEAAKLTCPYARGNNQFITKGITGLCHASQCMAWRWITPRARSEDRPYPFKNERFGTCNLIYPKSQM